MAELDINPPSSNQGPPPPGGGFSNFGPPTPPVPPVPSRAPRPQPEGEKRAKLEARWKPEVLEAAENLDRKWQLEDEALGEAGYRQLATMRQKQQRQALEELTIARKLYRILNDRWAPNSFALKDFYQSNRIGIRNLWQDHIASTGLTGIPRYFQDNYTINETSDWLADQGLFKVVRSDLRDSRGAKMEMPSVGGGSAETPAKETAEPAKRIYKHPEPGEKSENAKLRETPTAPGEQKKYVHPEPAWLKKAEAPATIEEANLDDFDDESDYIAPGVVEVPETETGTREQLASAAKPVEEKPAAKRDFVAERRAAEDKSKQEQKSKRAKSRERGKAREKQAKPEAQPARDFVEERKEREAEAEFQITPEAKAAAKFAAAPTPQVASGEIPEEDILTPGFAEARGEEVSAPQPKPTQQQKQKAGKPEAPRSPEKPVADMAPEVSEPGEIYKKEKTVSRFSKPAPSQAQVEVIEKGYLGPEGAHTASESLEGELQPQLTAEEAALTQGLPGQGKKPQSAAEAEIAVVKNGAQPGNVGGELEVTAEATGEGSGSLVRPEGPQIVEAEESLKAQAPVTSPSKTGAVDIEFRGETQQQSVEGQPSGTPRAGETFEVETRSQAPTDLVKKEARPARRAKGQPAQLGANRMVQPEAQPAGQSQNVPGARSQTLSGPQTTSKLEEVPNQRRTEKRTRTNKGGEAENIPGDDFVPPELTPPEIEAAQAEPKGSTLEDQSGEGGPRTPVQKPSAEPEQQLEERSGDDYLAPEFAPGEYQTPEQAAQVASQLQADQAKRGEVDERRAERDAKLGSAAEQVGARNKPEGEVPEEEPGFDLTDPQALDRFDSLNTGEQISHINEWLGKKTQKKKRIPSVSGWRMRILEAAQYKYPELKELMDEVKVESYKNAHGLGDEEVKKPKKQRTRSLEDEFIYWVKRMVAEYVVKTYIFPYAGVSAFFDGGIEAVLAFIGLNIYWLISAFTKSPWFQGLVRWQKWLLGLVDAALIIIAFIIVTVIIVGFCQMPITKVATWAAQGLSYVWDGAQEYTFCADVNSGIDGVISSPAGQNITPIGTSGQ